MRDDFKKRVHFKAICLGGAALAVLTLAGCAHQKLTDKLDKDQLGKLCNNYCAATAKPAAPGFAMMMKKAWVNGKSQYVPMRDILIQSVDDKGNPTLVTPYSATYGTQPEGDGPPIINKSEGLDPACFATEEYTTIPLSDVVLTTANTTITLVNFDRDGRLESRELTAGDPVYQRIMPILSPGGSGDYVDVQTELTNMARPSADDLFFNMIPVSNRDLNANGTPPKKTPFYTNLDTPDFSDEDGHVFFYVLLDSQLYFSRENAALITYAPDVEDAMDTFYTPFVQYPIVPALPQNVSEPDGTKMDVLTFHFIRDTSMGGADVDQCRYVYDKFVISKGQNSFTQRTPLFIDPEVTTRGVIAQ